MNMQVENPYNECYPSIYHVDRPLKPDVATDILNQLENGNLLHISYFTTDETDETNLLHISDFETDETEGVDKRIWLRFSFYARIDYNEPYLIHFKLTNKIRRLVVDTCRNVLVLSD